MAKKKIKKTIGWRELIDLPELRIKGLRAKIDTGARSSALHVDDLKVLSDGRIEFHIILNKNMAKKKMVAHAYKQGNVKSSIGVKSLRWYIKTRMRLDGVEKEIPISLVGREGMNYRMLVGRNALKGDFVVDVSKSYMTTPKKKRLRKLAK